jgi:hypothetical protein
MAVYMIRAGADGPVKIGVTNNPLRRLHALRTGHAESLRLIRVLDGGESVEKALHARFAAHRKSGEWFGFAPEMLAADIGYTDLPVPSGKRDNATGVRGLIDSLGGANSVAKALGMRIAAVSNWAMRDDIPHRHRFSVLRLALTKGVPWTPPGFEGVALAVNDNATPPPPVSSEAA